MDSPMPQRSTWTFLTNHTRVLSAIARDPWVRIRDLAADLQLTERTVQALVADLEEAGYLTHTRVGRRNQYQVIMGGKFRHPAEKDRDIGPLLRILAGFPDRAEASADGVGRDAADTARPRGGKSVSDDGR
ncbi:helix-turn-helix transcriptional regulator [Streptomyces sp. NPDC059909]|uniref:helix-turn-helix transcriptional regulator n=1 Tax=Streptomyces sp. NPDC059909 TaxID=3346998 RepID=UPI00364F22BB